MFTGLLTHEVFSCRNICVRACWCCFYWCVCVWGGGISISVLVREQSVFEELCCCNVGCIQVGKALIITISLRDCSVMLPELAGWGVGSGLITHWHYMLMCTAIMIPDQSDMTIKWGSCTVIWCWGCQTALKATSSTRQDFNAHQWPWNYQAVVVRRITNRSNQTCASTVTVKPQWRPLCASASPNDECHSVLCTGFLAEKQSVTLCLLSTAAPTDRHRRTPISPHSELTLYPDPRWHTSSSPRTVHVLRSNMHLHSWTPISSYSPVHDCALEQQSNFNLYGNIKGCCSCTPAHTHTRTSPHTSKASLHVWHLTPGNALDPQWQQAGGTATHS